MFGILSIFLQGGPGYARSITYEKITLTETYNPIIIDGSYYDLTVST